MTTYTVLNRHGDVQVEGASLSEAAQAVLGYDGHEYEIRKDEDGLGYTLWVSQFSRNSALGGRPLVRSAIYSSFNGQSEGDAEAEIFRKVIAHASSWDNQDVMTDESYAKLLADLTPDEG